MQYYNSVKRMAQTNNSSSAEVCLGKSILVPGLLDMSNGLPPPVVCLGGLELSVLVVLLVLAEVNEVDGAIDVAESPERVDEDVCVVAVLKFGWDVPTIVLEATEVPICELLLGAESLTDPLPAASVPHPPPPPLAGGVQRKVVAA